MKNHSERGFASHLRSSRLAIHPRAAWVGSFESRVSTLLQFPLFDRVEETWNKQPDLTDPTVPKGYQSYEYGLL